MYWFLIKKSFCDVWDNLLSAFVTNLIFLFFGLCTGYGYAVITNSLSESLSDAGGLGILVGALLVGMIGFSIISFAWGENAAKITDFKGISFLDFFKAVPGVLKDAILFGVMITVIAVISVYALDFYFIENQSLVGFFVGAIIMWLDVFLLLALQWFVPLRSAMHGSFKKTLRKCFLVFFDNTGYTVILFAHNLVLLVISVLFVGFFPSVSGILTASQNFLRIRLYKYDYLEEHTELTTRKERRKIPWEELIYDDREMLGPRKLRSFLFPWKDDSPNGPQDL